MDLMSMMGGGGMPQQPQQGMPQQGGMDMEAIMQLIQQMLAKQGGGGAPQGDPMQMIMQMLQGGGGAPQGGSPMGGVDPRQQAMDFMSRQNQGGI